MSFPKLKVYDKKNCCYIIPFNCEDIPYDDIDITYADGNWYITGGELMTEDRYTITIEN